MNCLKGTVCVYLETLVMCVCMCFHICRLLFFFILEEILLLRKLFLISGSMLKVVAKGMAVFNFSLYKNREIEKSASQICV